MTPADPYGPTLEQSRSHRPSQPVEPTHGDILAKLVVVENKLGTMEDKLHALDVRQWVTIATGLTSVACLLIGLMLLAVSPKLYPHLPSPIGALIQRSSEGSGSASSASSKVAPSPSSPTSATSAESSSSTPASTLTN